jgi:hypothetical protein
MLWRKPFVLWRFIRFKLHHWLMLFAIVHRFVVVRDANFALVQFYFRLALGKTDFNPVYEVLDDLIRFPPY